MRFTFFLLLLPFSLSAQNLFEPGSTYQAGTLVKDIYGTVWKVKQRIDVAIDPPAQNAYYSYVRAGEPEATHASGGKLYIVNVREKGILPSNTPAQNSSAMEALLKSIPEASTPSIYIPQGEYRFARTIAIYKRPINLFGDNGTMWGNSTKLYFPANTTGIVIDRGQASIQETIIEKVCLIGGGGSGDAARSGIYSNGRIKLRHVTLKGFGEHGLNIKADMDNRSDASGSSIEYCHALENGQDGFFAGRTDANAILFIGCDARDNGRFGFNDDSFLGNNYISCMAHYNKAGDYHVRDWGNASSLFIGCYSEGGNKISILGPKSTVIGGIWGTPYQLGDGKKPK